ncbi:MAG: hypothetical protein Devi2KO_40840 [Devosia indica]
MSVSEQGGKKAWAGLGCLFWKGKRYIKKKQNSFCEEGKGKLQRDVKKKSPVTKVH